MTSLILQIQSDAMDGASPVVSLLRKVRVAAVKLNLAEELQWINWELDGYGNVDMDDLPAYRRLTGVMKVKNPYHGLQPLHFADAEMAEIMSAAPCKQSIGELEALLAAGQGSLQVQLSQEHINILMKAMRVPMEPILTLDRTSVVRVLEAVRNLILNWSLEMEKAGVLGEGLTFNTQEIEKAQPAGQQFIIQNVGVLGNISGQATVSNNQTASVALNLDQVRDVVAQLKSLVTSLPTAASENLAPILDQLGNQLSEPTPQTSLIRTLLQSAKAICEGATGNVVASGAIALLTQLLGN